MDVEAAEPWMAPGRWGWDGGTGTTARVDPTRDTVGVLLTQRAMTGAQGATEIGAGRRIKTEQPHAICGQAASIA